MGNDEIRLRSGRAVSGGVVCGPHADGSGPHHVGVGIVADVHGRPGGTPARASVAWKISASGLRTPISSEYEMTAKWPSRP